MVKNIHFLTLLTVTSKTLLRSIHARQTFINKQQLHKKKKKQPLSRFLWLHLKINTASVLLVKLKIPLMSVSQAVVLIDPIKYP